MIKIGTLYSVNLDRKYRNFGNDIPPLSEILRDALMRNCIDISTWLWILPYSLTRTLSYAVLLQYIRRTYLTLGRWSDYICNSLGSYYFYLLPRWWHGHKHSGENHNRTQRKTKWEYRCVIGYVWIFSNWCYSLWVLQPHITPLAHIEAVLL